MKFEKSAEKARRPARLLALAVAALATSGIAIPYFVGGFEPAGLLPASVKAEGASEYFVTEPVTLLHAPRLTLDRGQVVGSSKPSGKAKPAFGRDQASTLLVTDAELTLDLGARAAADGTVQERLAAVVAPLMDRLRLGKFEKLSLRDSRLIVLRAGDRSNLLSDVNADIAVSSKGTWSAHGSLAFNGQVLKFDTALKVPEGHKRGASLPLTARVSGDLISVSLDGQVKLGTHPEIAASKASVTAPKLRDTARWLGSAWPDGPGLEAFEATGTLDWANGSISLDNAEVEIDENSATGSLSLTLTDSRPFIEGTLAFETLDASAYLSAPGEGGDFFLVGAGWPSLLQFAGLGPTSLVREIDADLRLSANATTAMGNTWGRSATTLTIKNARLLADLAELQLKQGSGAIQLEVDMSSGLPSYAIRGRLDGIDLTEASAALLGAAGVSGTGEAEFNLTTTGSTGQALAAALDGKLMFALPQGGRLGIDLAEVADRATAGQVTGWSEFAGTSTALDSLAAHFVARDGALWCHSVEGAAGGTRMRASGSVGLSMRDTDLEIALTAEDGQGRTTSAPRILQIRGPWTSPQIRLMTRPGKALGPLLPSDPKAPASVLR